MDVPRGGNAHFKESVYELHKRESHGFSPSVSHRLDHEVSLQGAGRRVAGADTNDYPAGVQRTGRPSYPEFCRENMSICLWKSRRILLSATSYGASRDGRRIGCRWSSLTCASATGGGISGLGATSPPRAATSRMMSYFSIFRSTNLPASAGSYSVVFHPTKVWMRSCDKTIDRDHERFNPARSSL
jgi:hypothetical protein